VEALGRIDIGIMPLSNDEWSRMKGGYKLYLYMAAGKPAVASPYGINADIVIGGETGFLAETEKDWLSAFEKLQQDVALRREMGLKARKIAEQKYSYNVCTKQLLDFLNE
jgi:glycosyltransferase involved in cell wall biosynthesis